MRQLWQLERFRPSLRPLPLLALGFWFLHWRDGAPRAARSEQDAARAVTLALQARGLLSEPRDVHFIPKSPTLLESPVERQRALVRAHRLEEPSDIFVVETRVAPGGTLLELDAVFNLSDSSAADEQNLVVSDLRAAWAIGTGDTIASVQFANFAGEPAPSGPDWTRPRRLQNALTNLQEVGQLDGVGRRAFRLEPAAYKVVLGFARGALLIDADSHKIRIADRGAALEGERYVKEVTPPKARPGNFVTWAVDRVRALPWFGDERMQWLKAVAFDGADHFEQIVSSVTGDDGSDTVKEELGDLFATGVAQTNPETGWPPPPMEPMLDPPLQGEGKWGSLEKDPFVQKNPGAPSPFVFSFIRTDRKRIYSQIFVTLWDPRQVELHAMSGTVEPISATGATGPGLVPRDPQVVSRYVAAFNGGFQAVHGEFGMMSERTLYLPPKPYGATVAELGDGSTAFGSWPEDTDHIPENIVSFRQNMTALVENGELNPWKRHWWGGLPPGWTEESRTVRSGLCMTKEGFVGYFYGTGIDPDVLGLAMKRARCSYGIHLDMNPGHTGLEFYRAAPKGGLPLPARKLEDVWEATGPVPGMQGWDFMSRRMIKFMALMNFPRYINAEARDFFYLTLRRVLPGEPLAPRLKPAEPGEGAWRVDGLPQQGWPYAVATTNLRTSPEEPDFRIGLIKLDAKLLRVAQPGDVDPKLVVELRGAAEAAPNEVTLFHSADGGFEIAYKPRAGARRVTSGLPADAIAAKDVSAAMGIDQDGMLVYARVAGGGHPAGDGERLAALLGELGCQTLIFLPRPVAALFGNKGEASNAPGIGVQLIRGEGPGAKRLFPDTPIVGPKKWAPLQQKRVRYK